MPSGPIVGIVLAAGMSRRLGRPKQLVEIDGVPLVRIVASTCLQSSLEDVVVVTGHESEAIAGTLDDHPVGIVHNADYESGQASSLKAGVRTAIELGADAVVVVLADQPGISSETIDRLIAARRDSGSWIGMATYGEQRGHPVLFGHEVFVELEGISGDQGGREVIKRYRQRVVLVDGGREQVPMDVDTEADVLALSQSSLDQS
jgi:molybdenum cofactor cytidylyltransferase